MGLITETCQRGMIATSGAETSGRVTGCPVYLFAGEVITGIVAVCSGAGSAQTLVKLGLLDTNGNVLRATADVKADFTTTGDKAENLTSTFTVVSDGVYVAAFLGVGGTQPSLGRMAGGPATGGAPFGAGTARVTYLAVGQTDMVGPFTWTTGNILFYFGVY